MIRFYDVRIVHLYYHSHPIYMEKHFGYSFSFYVLYNVLILWREREMLYDGVTFLRNSNGLHVISEV